MQLKFNGDECYAMNVTSWQIGKNDNEKLVLYFRMSFLVYTICKAWKHK